MKKTALLLSLLMLLTLALSACTQDTGSTTPSTESADVPPASEAPAGQDGSLTEEDLKNSKPNEYVQEKLDAGMDVLIGCSMIADVPILMEVWAGQITDVIEPLGFGWVINHAGGDTGNMISQIENYVTMGAAAIVLVPSDKDSVKDACLKAIDAGTSCIIFGLLGVDYCYSVYCDTPKFGEAEGKMAVAWAKMTFPDATADNPVKCASIYSSNVEDSKINGETATKTLDDDEICNVVYIQGDAQGSIDSGFTFAQNAFSFDPEIRIFICSTGPDALGASNFIMAQPGLDYSKYATFCQNLDNACLDAINNLAPANQAVLRGSAEEIEPVGLSIATCALKALYGEWKNPYEYLVPGSTIVQPGWDYSDNW